MRHPGAVTAGIAGGMLLLSGCGAVDLPLAGVRVAPDGTPYAVFRPCGGDDHQWPRLDGRPPGGADGPVTTGWDSRREKLSGDAEFPLLAPPGGRRARHRGKQELLPGHHYVLGFGHYVTGDSCNAVAAFTTERIGRLRPGQIGADGRAMSPRAFERLADDSC